jgi:hypothetical protein
MNLPAVGGIAKPRSGRNGAGQSKPVGMLLGWLILVGSPLGGTPELVCPL